MVLLGVRKVPPRAGLRPHEGVKDQAGIGEPQPAANPLAYRFGESLRIPPDAPDPNEQAQDVRHGMDSVRPIGGELTCLSNRSVEELRASGVHAGVDAGSPVSLP